MAAGRNWHLIETIDVVRHATGETVQLTLPEQIVTRPDQALFCTEQMPMPGIPKPDLDQYELVTWGVLPGDIGYIYVYGWFWGVEHVMFDHDTRGLIIDFRLNFGGNMFMSNPALAHLFDEWVYTIGFAKRVDWDDHLALAPVPNAPPEMYIIKGNPATYYDRPIAVLTGPGAVSSGDQVALRMTYHPRARVFGKPTASAFNGPATLPMSGLFRGRYAAVDAYRVEDPGDYLTHDGFPVDVPVWLTPDDVANGLDTVVADALAWILNARRVEQDGGKPLGDRVWGP